MSITMNITRLTAEIQSGILPEAGARYTMDCMSHYIDSTCIRIINDNGFELQLDSPLVVTQNGINCKEYSFAVYSGTMPICTGVICDGSSDDDYALRNIRCIPGRISETERLKITKHRGLVVWMTGLSGSGKSTIAQMTERCLLEEGIPTYLLDGDRLRKGLNSDLGFSDEDRTENQRRVAEVAALFRDAGLVVLVATISPLQVHRDRARELAPGAFLEVYVCADYATCQQRDPKQLYQKAAAGDINNFTGKGSQYQVPPNPDFILDTMSCTPEDATRQLLQAIHAKISKSIS